MRTKIFATETGFRRILQGKAISVDWAEIIGVYGINYEKITYDECFLILETKWGKIEIGELDVGFENFKDILVRSLPGFPVAWRSVLNSAPRNNEIQLWERKLATGSQILPQKLQ